MPWALGICYKVLYLVETTKIIVQLVVLNPKFAKDNKSNSKTINSIEQLVQGKVISVNSNTLVGTTNKPSAKADIKNHDKVKKNKLNENKT